MLYVDLFDSEAITKFAYDLAARDLVIFFKSGSVYAYRSVPRELFEGFRAAPSKGQYFQASIRAQFAGRALSAHEIAAIELASAPGTASAGSNGVLVEIASIEKPKRTPVFF